MFRRGGGFFGPRLAGRSVTGHACDRAQPMTRSDSELGEGRLPCGVHSTGHVGRAQRQGRRRRRRRRGPGPAASCVPSRSPGSNPHTARLVLLCSESATTSKAVTGNRYGISWDIPTDRELVRWTIVDIAAVLDTAIILTDPRPLIKDSAWGFPVGKFMSINRGVAGRTARAPLSAVPHPPRRPAERNWELGFSAAY